MNSLYFPQKTVTIRTGNKFSRQPVGEVIPNFLSAFSDYDVKAIQSLPGGDVKVTFASAEDKREIESSKSIKIGNVECGILGGGPPPTLVLVYYYPFEGPLDPLERELSKFGEIKSHGFQRYPGGLDVYSGTRLFRIERNGEIPRSLLVAGTPVKVWYRGQPLQCDICRKDHHARDCPFKGKCRRCLKEGHFARECTASWQTISTAHNIEAGPTPSEAYGASEAVGVTVAQAGDQVVTVAECSVDEVPGEGVADVNITTIDAIVDEVCEEAVASLEPGYHRDWADEDADSYLSLSGSQSEPSQSIIPTVATVVDNLCSEINVSCNGSPKEGANITVNEVSCSGSSNEGTNISNNDLTCSDSPKEGTHNSNNVNLSCSDSPKEGTHNSNNDNLSCIGSPKVGSNNSSSDLPCSNSPKEGTDNSNNVNLSCSGSLIEGTNNCHGQSSPNSKKGKKSKKKRRSDVVVADPPSPELFECGQQVNSPEPSSPMDLHVDCNKRKHSSSEDLSEVCNVEVLEEGDSPERSSFLVTGLHRPSKIPVRPKK